MKTPAILLAASRLALAGCGGAAPSPPVRRTRRDRAGRRRPRACRRSPGGWSTARTCSRPARGSRPQPQSSPALEQRRPTSSSSSPRPSLRRRGRSRTMAWRSARAGISASAGKDNGVLLIVAPNERQVRIEVGYGLEAILTNARAARDHPGTRSCRTFATVALCATASRPAAEAIVADVCVAQTPRMQPRQRRS